MNSKFGLVFLLQLLAVVFGASTIGDFPSNDLGYGYLPDGTPLTEWFNRTYNDPGPQVPLAEPAGEPVEILWKPPRPADGQSPFTDTIPWDNTLFLPFQNFSDISLYQLNLFMATYNQIITIAAAASGVAIEDGPKVFLKQAFYTLCIWHPEVMQTLRLTNVEDIWTVQMLDDVFGDMALQMHKQFIALYRNNVEDVIVIADNSAYAHHGYNQATPNAKMTRITFMHLIDAQMGASKFFLGAGFNEEVESALESVFTFLAAMNVHYLDLYDIGCLKRSEEKDYIVFNSAVDNGAHGNRDKSKEEGEKEKDASVIELKKNSHTVADFVGKLPPFGF